MKLTKEEIFVIIESLQFLLEKGGDVCNDRVKEIYASAIFKLQHQLKHLEDKETNKKEEYKIFGEYNPVEEFQKVINSVKK